MIATFFLLKKGVYYHLKPKLNLRTLQNISRSMFELKGKGVRQYEKKGMKL